MTTNPGPGETSGYLAYLPAIFQEAAQSDQPNRLGRFLLAFEQILSGLGEVDAPGLEEVLDGIRGDNDDDRRAGLQRYFDPGWVLQDSADAIKRLRAPAEFLTWLAGWVAVGLRADLDELRQRDLIARAVTLYRGRGSRRGLEEMIRIYTRLSPTIDEQRTRMQLGVHSTIGRDTMLDGGPPHYFKVTIRLPAPDPEERARMAQLVNDIIALEKPAHTHFSLQIVTPAFTIGKYSTIGVDTLIGIEPVNDA